MSLNHLAILMVVSLSYFSSWRAKLSPTSLPLMSLNHLAIPMVVSLGNISS